MKIKVGDRFTNNKGDIISVVNCHNYYKIDIVFISTGYKTTVSTPRLEKGKVKDKLKPSVCGVGYIGEGVINSKHPSYTSWRCMLHRCYTAHPSVSPAYVGCTVCEEWHDLQNYGVWYDLHYPSDGGKYHLDKDIRVKGNKLYSPETCLFVTGADNLREAHAKSFKIISPEGELVEGYNISKFCRDNNLNCGNFARVVAGNINYCKGWTTAPCTPEETPYKDYKGSDNV